MTRNRAYFSCELSREKDEVQLESVLYWTAVLVDVQADLVRVEQILEGLLLLGSQPDDDPLDGLELVRPLGAPAGRTL